MSDKKNPSKSEKKPTVPSRENEPEKKIVICNRGLLYNVRVPREEAHDDPLSLSASEYDRILARARDPSFLAKEKESGAKASQIKNDDTRAAEERKRQMIEKDARLVKKEVRTDEECKKQNFERYRRMRCKAQMENDNQIHKLDTCIQRCKIQAELDTQLEWKKHCEAVEISKEKAEFELVRRCHRDAHFKHEEKERRRKEEGRRYLDALKGQIKEKEHAAAARRREWLDMAQEVSDEVCLENTCIDELKEERLSELRASGIGDKYCNYAKRKTKQVEAKSKHFQYHAQ
ncbi:nuclear mitotic apparatus protein 1-like [Hippocampus zosterae]|uniref:nuclear mitotic apparatus protein 1-like n=1 Tax=Hippocampus zosterae TaxID=109293 RepID=UPI00223E75D0|nr:nuclear mitotic apparatus protein 1-like [Hippocampus zosterae]